MDQVRPGVPPWLSQAAAVSWRVLVVLAAVVALILGLSEIAVVAISVFVALVLASVLWVPTRWLRGLRFPPGLAAIVVVLTFLAGFAGMLALLGPPISREVSTQGQELWSRGKALLDRVAAATPIPGDDAEQALERVRERMDQETGAIASFFLAGAVRVGEAITGVLLTVVLLFFFLRDGDRMVRWLLDRTTSTRREDARAVLARAWTTLRRFVGGTAIVALADAVGIGLGLWIIGVPLALPLAVITFFSAFLPIVGATVAGLLAVLVALGSGGLKAGLLTLAVVLAVQQAESNLLQPLVLGRSVPLHPVAILVTITSGALAWGLLGAFISVPLAAMISSAGNELRQRGMLGVRAAGPA